MTRTTLARRLALLSLWCMTLAVSGFAPARAEGANPAVRGTLWKARYNGPGSSSDGAAALRVSPDGATVFVTGYSFDPSTSYDYATVAYEAATGTQRWVARYNGPGNGSDFATALGVSPDGTTVFVTGYSFDPSTSYDYATVAYDAASGTQQWVARYDGPGSGDDVAYGLAVSPSGAAVFVTGYSSGSTNALDDATFHDVHALLKETVAALRETYRPAGLNVGMNMGEAAGAGIAEHLHYHALPRWRGDVNFMPVIADVKVISESLDDTWERLAALLRTPADDAVA